MALTARGPDLTEVVGSYVPSIGATGIAGSTNIVVKSLVKPGEYQWIKFEHKANDASLNMYYFDLENVAVGINHSGVMTPAIRKVARGWVEVSLTGDNGIGSGNNWIAIYPAIGDGALNFTGDARRVAIYVDKTELYEA